MALRYNQATRQRWAAMLSQNQTIHQHKKEQDSGNVYPLPFPTQMFLFPNPGAEDGTNNWTTAVGTLSAVNWWPARDYTHFFGGSAPATEAYQIITLSDQFSPEQMEQLKSFELSWWQQSAKTGGALDQASMSLTQMDKDGNVLSEKSEYLWGSPGETWYRRAFTADAVKGVAKIRLIMAFKQIGSNGPFVEAGIDIINLFANFRIYSPNEPLNRKVYLFSNTPDYATTDITFNTDYWLSFKVIKYVHNTADDALLIGGVNWSLKIDTANNWLIEGVKIKTLEVDGVVTNSGDPVLMGSEYHAIRVVFAEADQIAFVGGIFGLYNFIGGIYNIVAYDNNDIPFADLPIDSGDYAQIDYLKPKGEGKLLDLSRDWGRYYDGALSTLRMFTTSFQFDSMQHGYPSQGFVAAYKPDFTNRVNQWFIMVCDVNKMIGKIQFWTHDELPTEDNWQEGFSNAKTYHVTPDTWLIHVQSIKTYFGFGAVPDGPRPELSIDVRNFTVNLLTPGLEIDEQERSRWVELPLSETKK